MPIELYELCPLCGSENLKKKSNINGYTLTTCISCSLQFIQEKISDEFLQNYYEKSSLCTSVQQTYVNKENISFLNYAYETLAKKLREKERERERERERELPVYLILAVQMVHSLIFFQTGKHMELN